MYIKKIFTKFNKWMDYNPPGAMTSKGWRLFQHEFKEVAPIRFWVKNTARRKYILSIKWKYESISRWIMYRTIYKYNKVDTGLKPSYYSKDTLMLHVNFNLLKDFVEVEQALHTYWWSEEYNDASWLEKHMPFYYVIFPFRNPEIGLKHLDWAATLDDPSLLPHERNDAQAAAAREIKALYKWWVEERPARKDVIIPDYDRQGLGDLGMFDDDFDQDAPDYKAHLESFELQEKKDKEWEKEDEDMLVRLMKIRKSLWT